jgi:hypothetical protein
MRFALSLITNTFPLLSLAFPTIPSPVLGFLCFNYSRGLAADKNCVFKSVYVIIFKVFFI